MSARSTMMASALPQPRELPTSHRSGRAIVPKGTLTVQGLTPGTALVLSGKWIDSFFNTIAIPATDVAVVATTEPGTAGLLALALRPRLRRSAAINGVRIVGRRRLGWGPGVN